MNWFANLYFGEGPGIDKDAPKPEGLRLLGFVLGREWWTLIKLNLVFFAFCLPLVTIPAAFFAMVTVSLSMIEDKNVWLMRDFWSAFRARFVLSSLIGLVFMGAGGLSFLAITTYARAAQDNLLFATPLAIACLVAIALPLYAMHVLVALARADGQSLMTLLKVAAIGLVSRPLPGIGALAFVALIWLMHIAFYPASVLLPVLFAFSLSALVLSFAVRTGVQFGFSHLAARPHKGTPGSPETQSA